MSRAAPKLLLVATFAYFLTGCAPSRYVKPLEKKQAAASFSFGGPLIKFSNAPIPIPFTTLGFGYGFTSTTTGYAHLHTTSALFGNLQTDLGASILLTKKNPLWGLSVSPALQMAYSIGNQTGLRIWPTCDLNAFLHLSQKPSYVYAGLNGWFELSSKKAHGLKQQRHLIPNIHAGYTVVKPKWQHQLELDYLGLGIPNTPGVVDYIGVSGKGALGIYYSLTRKF
jgi:hypothetical protein